MSSVRSSAGMLHRWRWYRCQSSAVFMAYPPLLFSSPVVRFDVDPDCAFFAGPPNPCSSFLHLSHLVSCPFHLLPGRGHDLLGGEAVLLLKLLERGRGSERLH